MNYTKIIEWVIKEHGGLCSYQNAELIKKIDEQIHFYETLNKEVSKLWNKKHELATKYTEQLIEIDKKLTEIQAGCNHPDTYYQADPAGGSDSGYKCNVCGKEYR